ncbi:VWA domain-containing protein [Alcaligenaceae bacterium]|nr:VWA domain-containing protein [Alcaligenaceae bacterium]
MKVESHFIRRLKSSQRGAVVPLFLVTAVLILGTTFGGIDLIRYSVAQGRLQNALDGATLSAGRNLANLTANPTETEVTQWQTDAYEYFRSNLPDGFLGSNINSDDLQITYQDETVNGYTIGQHIEMTARGDLPLVSTGFLNVSSMGLQASNKAVRRTRSDLELVLALDNTGSMKGSRMSTLKAAAKELSSTVLGASQASGVPGRVFVGLVPFADTINVGNTPVTQAWLGEHTGTNVVLPTDSAGNPAAMNTNFIQSSTQWMGCIVEPPFTTQLPAEVLTPSSGFRPLHLTLRTDKTIALSSKGKSYERILDGHDQLKVFAANGASYDRRVGAKRTTNKSDIFTIYSAANPSNCKSSRLTRFLSEDLDTIHAAINKMDADGNTLVPLGLLWGWRMLHPGWQGAWGVPGMPREPEPKVLSKVIVLLTDGENAPPGAIGIADSSERQFAYELGVDIQTCTDKNFKNGCSTALRREAVKNFSVSYTDSSSSNDSGNRWQEPMTSLKVREPFGANNGSGTFNRQSTSIGWDDQTSMNTKSLDAYLAALCENVKEDINGIKIYTVTLGNVGSSTEKLMAKCSSGPTSGYAYNANNVSDLDKVFKSIAGALTELRLTQ